MIRSKLISAVALIIILKIKVSAPIDWDRVKCSSDVIQGMPHGTISKGRFPWLGVVQHSFHLAGQTQYAVTSGVLIHPAYVIAAAEDVARIPRQNMINNTKFVAWYSDDLKFAIDVKDYLLHPDYDNKVTFATLALLELYAAGETGLSDMEFVVLPVCLPMAGSGSFEDLYAARISDDSGETRKEAMKMKFVSNADCDRYYVQAELTYAMMKPKKPLCASAEWQDDPCVWEAGVALITKQSWGHWMLLGFSMRSPGCGAPARFVSIHDFLPWIDAVLSKMLTEESEMIKLFFRRQSPLKVIMYPAGIELPKEQGQCEDKKVRGTIVYKEHSEIITTKNFAQGFYYISVTQVASFMCVTLNLEVLTRSKASIWVEHNCHRDVTGLHHGAWEGPDYRKLECFAYFKTSAFVEFRFWFSFRAAFELSMYGKLEKTIRMPNPFVRWETTLPWEPTDAFISWYYWHPVNKWYWFL